MYPMLDGVRIVDITTILLGPYATQILGDMGAEVIKIESLTGDMTRAIPPQGGPGFSAMFANANRNKRSLALDLKSEQGKDALKRLLAEADVLVHNMRQEAMDRLGFDFEAVRVINPRIIYCAAPGYGRDGPYAGRPAYDDIMQASCGLAGLHQMRDGIPTYAPSVTADKVGGLHVVYAVLAALFRRERSGGGAMHVEAPMFECVASFALNEHLMGATFEDDGKTGYHRTMTVHRNPYPTKDGWIGVLPYTEKQWRSVLREIGREDISESDWFTDIAERSRRSADMYVILREAVAQRTTAEWLEIFERLDVPNAPVNTTDDLLNDKHLNEVGFFTPNFASDYDVKRTIRQPIVIDGVQRQPDTVPPELGADTRAILSDLGYSAADIDGMIEAGVAVG